GPGATSTGRFPSEGSCFSQDPQQVGTLHLVRTHPVQLADHAGARCHHRLHDLPRSLPSASHESFAPVLGSGGVCLPRLSPLHEVVEKQRTSTLALTPGACDAESARHSIQNHHPSL